MTLNRSMSVVSVEGKGKGETLMKKIDKEIGGKE